MLEFDSATLFKKVVDSIRDICKDTTFEISNGSLDMQCMDSSHVCIVVLHLSDSLKANTLEPITMSLNLSNLYKVLQTFDAESPVTIKLLDNQAQIVSLSPYRKCESKVALMDIEMDSLVVPEMEYPVRISFYSSDFVRIIKDMHEFGDTLRITAESDQVVFATKGDITDMQITIVANDKCSISINCACEISFSIKYLLLFLKAHSLSENVYLSIGEDMPMKVTYSITSQDNLSFYLAPKINDDA